MSSDEDEYNSNHFESENFETSESESEDWGSDGEKDWQMKVVGVEIAKGNQLRHEVHWQDWARSDGTSNTYHRKGDDSLKGLTSIWDKAWKKKLAKIDEQLAENDDTALEIQIWSDDDLVGTPTRYHAQGFDEKLNRVDGKRRKLKSSIALDVYNLSEGLLTTEKELLDERLGSNEAQQMLKELYSDESEEEQNENRNYDDEDEMVSVHRDSTGPSGRTRSATNKTLSSRGSMVSDSSRSQTLTNHSHGFNRAQAPRGGARKTIHSRPKGSMKPPKVPEGMKQDRFLSSSSSINMPQGLKQTTFISPPPPSSLNRARSTSGKFIAMSASAGASSGRPPSSSVSTASTSTLVSPLSIFKFMGPITPSDTRFESRPIKALPRQKGTRARGSTDSVDTESQTFYSAVSHASDSHPIMDEHSSKKKRKKGKAKETRSQLEMLSIAWTEAAAVEDAAPITFVNDVDDEDGPPDMDGFRYLEMDRVTRVKHLKRRPPPAVFLRCDCRSVGDVQCAGESDEDMDVDYDSGSVSTTKEKGKRTSKWKGKGKALPRTERLCGVSCGCQKVSELQNKHGRRMRTYTNDGLFRFTNRPGTEIVECNEYCSCSPDSCVNRVAQRPRGMPMEIFKTDGENGGKGWGIRCPEDIKRGMVLGSYTGELIHRSTAAALFGEERTYLFDLDGRDVSDIEDEEDLHSTVPIYSINAKRCGNWTRFLNHSCSPNLAVYTAVWDTIPEQNIPHLMFFALQDIPSGTELTLDYHAGDELPEKGKAKMASSEMSSSKEGKGKRKKTGGTKGTEEMRPWGSRECFCGAERCRGWV